MRVDGRTFHEVDVRIVAATNRDLDAEWADGSFRADLFYRTLKEYSSPGNVRELRNAVEQAVTLCGGKIIRTEHLPTRVRNKGAASSDPPDSGPNALLRTNKLNFGRQRILEALDQCAGNQSRAAALLGISRGTLISRLAEFELPRPRKKV